MNGITRRCADCGTGERELYEDGMGPCFSPSGPDVYAPIWRCDLCIEARRGPVDGIAGRDQYGH